MIFVTGGTGFLGRHLIAALCRDGFRLRVLSRHPEKSPWLSHYPNVEVVRGDLLDYGILATAIRGCRYVIHAGGHFRFWGDANKFVQTNILGTRNILDAVKNTDIDRFIHISSIAVIGRPDPTHIIDETYPPSPADVYQHSKYKGEQLVTHYHRKYGVPIVILRPGAFYGPSGTYAFNRLFFRDPMRGIIMQIDGGKYIIFPAYISDVASAIIQSLTLSRIGEIYNICGDWISHKDAFDIVCEEANLVWPRLPIQGWMGIVTSRFLEILSHITKKEPFWPINLRSYVYNNWRVSNEKACRELGFVPTSFRDGARRTIKWYLAGQPQDIPEFLCNVQAPEK